MRSVSGATTGRVHGDGSVGAAAAAIQRRADGDASARRAPAAALRVRCLPP